MPSVALRGWLGEYVGVDIAPLIVTKIIQFLRKSLYSHIFFVPVTTFRTIFFTQKVERTMYLKNRYLSV